MKNNTISDALENPPQLRKVDTNNETNIIGIVIIPIRRANF